MSTEKEIKFDNFSDRLREARKLRGWGQEMLAEKLSVSTGAVGNWEIGPKLPTAENLGKIAAVLGVSTSWLLYGEEKSGLEVKDAPNERSPYSYMELPTLQKTLVDLTSRLHTAAANERKYIIGNLVEVVAELEGREINSTVAAGTGRLLGKVSDAVKRDSLK